MPGDGSRRSDGQSSGAPVVIGELPANVSEERPGKIGPYSVVEQLGQGGMAMVYRARLHGAGGFQRDVVLKAMLPALAQHAAIVQMFEAEARITAQLRHPNIVQVEDYGVAGAIPYLIMEYLDGKNLSQLRNALNKQKRRMPLAIAVSIARDLCLALGYAHGFVDAKGERIQVIHRDVSPSNVMVQRDGSVRLLDFGVAKLSSAAGEAVTTSLKGKFAYMSPEQVNQEPIDRRCDVFAAGIVLHEMLTGKRLFGTKSELETLRRVSAAEAAPPSALNPEVTPAVDALVMRALSRRREDRFDSGQKMAEALDALKIAAGRRELAELMREVFPPGGSFRPATTNLVSLGEQLAPDIEIDGDTDAGQDDAPMDVTDPQRRSQRIEVPRGPDPAMVSGSFEAGTNPSPSGPIELGTNHSDSIELGTNPSVAIDLGANPSGAIELTNPTGPIELGTNPSGALWSAGLETLAADAPTGAAKKRSDQLDEAAPTRIQAPVAEPLAATVSRKPKQHEDEAATRVRDPRDDEDAAATRVRGPMDELAQTRVREPEAEREQTRVREPEAEREQTRVRAAELDAQPTRVRAEPAQPAVVLDEQGLFEQASTQPRPAERPRSVEAPLSRPQPDPTPEVPPLAQVAQPRPKRGALLFVAAALVLGGIGVGAFFLARAGTRPPAGPVASQPAAPVPAPSPPARELTAPSPPPPQLPVPATPAPPPPPSGEPPTSLVGLGDRPPAAPSKPAEAKAESRPTPRSRDAATGHRSRPAKERSVKEGRIVDPFEGAE